jgi:lysophospholipase L1-like esterase
MRKLIFLLALLTLLIPFPVQATHVPPFHVYCMGDSVTAGTGSTYAPTTSYPAVLATKMYSAVYNDGIGGQTTAQMITRFSDNVTSGSQTGDYVIIWGGHNDILGGDNSTVKTNLQSMYDTAHTAGLKVVAVTLSPFKNYSTGSQTMYDQEDIVNTWILAKPTHVDYVFDEHVLVQDPTDHQKLLVTYDSGDHAHLNDAGYALVAATIYNTVWQPITTPLTNSGTVTRINATTLNVTNLRKQ